MKKYRVLKGCSCEGFAASPAKPGQPPVVLDAGELKTAGGDPLLPDVIAHLVKTKCLAEEQDEAAEAVKPAKAKKGQPADTPKE